MHLLLQKFYVDDVSMSQDEVSKTSTAKESVHALIAFASLRYDLVPCLPNSFVEDFKDMLLSRLQS